MKIVDFDGNKINGCFSMMYLGIEISCSTIMNKDRCEVALFEDDTYIDNANSIAHAMEIIDERKAKCS